MTDIPDPVELAQALIRCPSVTPADAGALDVVQGALEGLGFNCHRMTFSEAGTADVDNLYASIGEGSPNFCFAGHIDVVGPGDAAAWSHDPFSGEIVEGRLYGRGAVDMKGAIACFVSAAGRYLSESGDGLKGSISMLITGDEEGPSINGTLKVLDWLKERGEAIDACLVGEPTNQSEMGDSIKIGRRGSLYGRLTVHGTQGHSAYPDLADNPIPRLIRMMTVVNYVPLDEGNRHFEPSKLTITSIDVANDTANVIPARAEASFNIRFNDTKTPQKLEAWLREQFDKEDIRYDLDIEITGEAFLTPPGDLSGVISAAAEKVTGRKPELNTSGGTSDARFIKDHCPVAEFGLVGDTAHKVNENTAVADIKTLSEIYLETLNGFFAADYNKDR